MKFLATISILFLTYFLQTEHQNKDRVADIVAKLEQQETLMLNYQITNSNRRLIRTLDKTASRSDLIDLMNSPNATVFCSSYLILTKRKDEYCTKFLEDYLNMPEQEWLEWNETINRINHKHKSDLVMLYSKSDFVEDVYKRYKFLDIFD